MSGDAGIGRRVRASRARLGWTREKLAVGSGLSWSAIAQIESGRRENPRPATLSALARALGVTIDYLVDGGPTSASMLEHRAFVYDDDDEFSRAAEAFLAEGLERSEPTLAATTEHNGSLIRDRMGADADAVRIEDAGEFLSTPDVAMAALTDYVSSCIAEGAPWVRIIGEPLWAGRSPDEVQTWTRFESLINVVFASAPVSMVCSYDQRALDPAVIELAHHTHPELVAAGGVQASDTYRDPVDFTIRP